MFCPSCGTEYTLGLPYCNRCGANLNSALDEPTGVITVNVTKAIAAIGTTMAVLTLGGFMTLIIGAVKLAEKTNLGSDPIIALIVLGILTILIIDILLGRQLSRLIEASLSSGKSQQRKRGLPTVNVPSELGRPAPSPALSVTENTTRFLEHEYRAPSKSEARPTSENLKN
jgi:hypothetical protein